MRQVDDAKGTSAPAHPPAQPPAAEPAVPFTQVHGWLRRSLEHAQDVIVVGLALVLFAIMVRSLMSLVGQTLAPAVDFRPFLGEVLFMMILIELLRLLVIYLHEHHVAITAFVLALGVLLRFGDLRGRRRGPARRFQIP